MRVKQTRWERKADERPAALLQAALEVFSRQGYRATRLEVVAEAAGVSKGTIYNYFKNKEDLLERALEERVRILWEQTEAALEGFQGTPPARLRFILRRYWMRSQEKDWSRFHRLMLGEIANELPDLFALWLEKATGRAWKILEGIIAEGQKSGDFRKDIDALATARFALSGIFHQAFLQAHIGAKKWGAFPPERLFESALDLILAGLKPAKPSGKKHA